MEVRYKVIYNDTNRIEYIVCYVKVYVESSLLLGERRRTHIAKNSRGTFIIYSVNKI